jgi:hypothetical protein
LNLLIELFFLHCQRMLKRSAVPTPPPFQIYAAFDPVFAAQVAATATEEVPPSFAASTLIRSFFSRT